MRNREVSYSTYRCSAICWSLSSLKLGFATYTYLLNYLLEAEPRRLLLSAYDLSIKQAKKIRNELGKTDLILDSGGYELRQATVVKDWEYSSYLEIAKIIEPSTLVSFDHPDLSLSAQILLFDHMQKELSYLDSQFMFVIPEIKHPLEIILEFINEHIEFDILGIALTNLGATMEDQISSLHEITTFRLKNSLDFEIHILGCGDPKTMDSISNVESSISFDGTSWYRYFLDRESGELHQDLFSRV